MQSIKQYQQQINNDKVDMSKKFDEMIEITK